LIKLKLSTHVSFPWENFNNIIFSRGYFYSLDGAHITIENINKELSNNLDFYSFKNFIKNIDGCFSIIVYNKEKDEIFVANDRLRGFPIFYYLDNNQRYVITDVLRKNNNQSFDDLSLYEFINLGYVSGKETLLKKVFQVQSGECLVIDKDNIKVEYYYKFLHSNYFDETVSDLYLNFKNILINTFSCLIDSSKGKPLIVPLSGGLDSRLILSTLHELNFTDVKCFTYGLSNSKEVQISQSIASELGFEWHFVKYDKNKWQKISKSKILKDYFSFSGNYTSTPHIQDFLAVFELKENKIIPSEAIIVPGHTGDFISGGHIPSLLLEQEISHESLYKMIIETHYIHTNQINIDKYEYYNSKIKLKILDQISQYNINSIDDLASIFEFWEWRERQSKFIINSCRVYEFFEYEWRIPLWNLAIMQFWSRVPLNLRFGKKLYKDFLLKDDYKNIYSSYNYKNYGENKLLQNFKKLSIGKFLSGIHKRYNAYQKYKYIGLVGYDQLMRKYLDSYNIKSVISKKYLEYLKIDNDEFDFIR